MIDRITKNEERLDSVLNSIKMLEDALNEFRLNRKNISLLNKYYGSNNWFKDKEAYESGKISGIKAGVLSEDAVWNTNEEINDLMKEMKLIVNNNYKK